MHADFKGELLRMHRELLAGVLELLAVLTDRPSLYARQVRVMLCQALHLAPTGWAPHSTFFPVTCLPFPPNTLTLGRFAVTAAQNRLLRCEIGRMLTISRH